MPTGEHLIVLVDYFSRWIEVDIVRSTSTEVIIKHLDSQFARHGVPKTLRTDNEPNLLSKEMTDFLKQMGVVQRQTTPLWPRANGEVERQNKNLLKAMRAAHAEKKN
jgi:transposase InsO family protein